jgi:transcription antitermination factor NusG
LSSINNTYGVSRLLTSVDSGIPHSVNDKVINDIIQKCKKSIYFNNLKEGNEVICQTFGSGIHGIFKEFCGKNRAKVLLRMLNRPMEVLINKDLIQKIL